MSSKTTCNFILECLNMPGEIVLDKPEQNYSCGRGKENHIVCLGLTVSRRHCIFVRSKEELYVSDLESSNGIYINGIRQIPHKMVKLNKDDIIGIGCDFSSADDKNMFAYKLRIETQDEKAKKKKCSALPSTASNASKSTGCCSFDNKSTCMLKRVNEENCNVCVPKKMRKLKSRKHSLNRSEGNRQPSPNKSDTNDERDHDKMEDVIIINENSRTQAKEKSNSVSHDNNSLTINDKAINAKEKPVCTSVLDNKNSNKLTSTSWSTTVLANATKKKPASAAVSNLEELLNAVNISPITKDEGFQTRNVSIHGQSESSLTETASNTSRRRPSQTATPTCCRRISDKSERQETMPRRIVNSTPKVHTNISKNSSAPEQNFVASDGTVIKMEHELQITDYEGSEILNCTTNKAGSVVSPIKLKKIKQEPKTRFSVIDVVNLSDSEDDIFPCSQLFDNEFDAKVDPKIEIKQEMSDNAFHAAEDPDEVILLSDSEDKDNVWLERLSRSQVVNDDDDDDVKCVSMESLSATSKVEKTESLLLSSSVPVSTEKLSKQCQTTELEGQPVAPSMHISSEASTPVIESASPNTSMKESTTVNTLASSPLSKQLQRVLAGEITVTCASVQTSDYNESFGSSLDKSAVSESKLNFSGRKPPQVIDPPHLIKGRRKSLIDQDINESKKQKSRRLSSKEKKELEEKRKIDQYLHKIEQRRRRMTHKWAECLPVGKVTGDSLSKEEKKTLANERKAKLKKLTEEKKRLNENEQTVKRPVVKPKAKVSAKNRGEFLLDEGRNTSMSKSISDKIPAQSKSSSCSFEKQTGSPPIVNKSSSVTETKTIGIIKTVQEKNDLSTETELSNVTQELEHSLKLNGIRNCSGNSNEIQNANISNIANKVSPKSLPPINSKNVQFETDESSKAAEPVTQSSIQPVMPTQNENCPPNRLGLKQTAAVKKRVTFCTNMVKVHEFEIESQNSLKKLLGKDAPIPRDKLLKKPVHNSAACPKIEEFLLHIFKWNPVWLEEQRFLKTTAPVIKEHELRPLLSHYISYEEYYNIVLPLLLLETWCSITKEFETGENNIKRPTMMCSIVENSIAWSTVPSTQLQTSTLLLEVLVTKPDLIRQRHPNYGDLVFFEYVENIIGKQIFHKVFAYVTSVHQTILTPNTYFNKDLLNYVKNPHALLTYTIMTRALEKNIPTNRVQRLRSVTYLRASMRMVQALQYLPLSPIIDLILNPQPDSYQLPPMAESHRNTPLITNDNLNSKQLEAVLRVTESVVRQQPKLCFIHGPPGTGKSKVIVNIVTQILYGDNRYKNNKTALRMLVCAPSNAAIDEIVVRLLAIRATISHNRFKMVRLGRPETMHPSAKHISVTELAKRDVKRTTSSYSSSAVSDDNIEEEKLYLEAQINAVKCEIGTSQNMDEVYKKHLKRKLADMTAKYELLQNRKAIGQMDPRDLQKLQRAAENRVLLGADIITCTLSSCYTNQMESLFGGNRERISVCIVDEATQSCEAETLIPLMLGVNTLVLVGDPNQLPATVISQQAKRLGLDQSLFSRIQGTFELRLNNPVIMLDVQYRMACSISYWPNKYFYGGKLKNASASVLSFPYHSYRILNLDSNQNDDKFSNTNEAEFISNMILCMMINGNPNFSRSHTTIGILTPYNNQRTLMLSRINQKTSELSDNVKKNFTIEVNTVDSFQGQERDIIVMSCVRSHGIGFLSDKQRLCVALTRAKHSLIMCGNFNTFMRDSTWKALLSDAKWRRVFFNVPANALLTEITPLIVK